MAYVIEQRRPGKTRRQFGDVLPVQGRSNWQKLAALPRCTLESGGPPNIAADKIAHGMGSSSSSV